MNFEERRKSLLTLSKIICQCDEQKSGIALASCEDELALLKERTKALESLLARAGCDLMSYVLHCQQEKWSEDFTADTKLLISEIDEALQKNRDKKIMSKIAYERFVLVLAASGLVLCLMGKIELGIGLIFAALFIA